MQRELSKYCSKFWKKSSFTKQKKACFQKDLWGFCAGSKLMRPFVDYKVLRLRAKDLLLARLFVKVPRPGDSEGTSSVFESSCHLLQSVSGVVTVW